MSKQISPLKLAVIFHDIYESLAPKFGYETKEETKVFKAHTPNGKLMIEVCREMQEYLHANGFIHKSEIRFPELINHYKSGESCHYINGFNQAISETKKLNRVSDEKI